MLRKIKNSLVPNNEDYHRVLSGICRGCYLPLNLQNQFIRYLGLYEREIHKMVESLVREGTCCYDLGAADGYYTLALAQLTGAYGKVLAFEADDILSAKLPTTIRRNASRIRAEIIPMNYFVGKTTDNAKKFITIDYVVYEMHHCPPDFLKIDVEGAEYEVLQGAYNSLNEYHPGLIIEVHSLDLERKCQDLLVQQGYEVQTIDQGKRLFWKEMRPTQHNRWIVAQHGSRILTNKQEGR